jgi:PAS domain S-box-containing protein
MKNCRKHEKTMVHPQKTNEPSTAALPTSIRVLILEDEPRDADLMARELRRAGLAPEVRVVRSRPKYIEALESFTPDLILADCSLPQLSASDALLIRNQSAAEAVFIIVSGTIKEDQAVACMKLGAADYLLKDRLARLAPAVLRALEKRQLVVESHRTQQALRRSERRYRELFQKMSNAVVVYTVVDEGRDFVFSDLNPAAERIEKIKRQEVLGKSVREVFPGIAAAGLLKVFRQVWRNGQNIEQPLIHYQDDRISGWRRNSVYKLNDHEVVAVYEDMSEQVLARQDLQASETKYRSIIEHIGLGIVLIDPEMKVLELNPQMRKWFPHAQYKARPLCYEVFCDPPRKDICANCPIHATLQDGHVHELIHDARVSGDKRKFRIVTSPIRDDQGRVTAAIEIVEDITARQRMESQLRQAQKMEAIGNLAGGIAHDFNNILSAIIGFSELCVDEAGPDSPLQDNLQEVLRAGHRAKDLVRQILAFSRQNETKLKPIQSGLIIKEALKLLRSTLPTTIEIDSQIHSHSLIMGNPTQIHQIIMNLGANAAYAMGADGGTLTVRLTDMPLDDPSAREVHLAPGTYQRLTVTDTGEGIAREHLDAIFEPYFSTKPEGEGTGLGLSVVHGIVHSLQGGIRVRSTPGKGTGFDIFLPIMNLQSHGPQPAEQLPAGGRERILFIDDEPPIAGMAKRHLEKFGYTVEIRTDSREALELFKKRHAEFDLVITDMTMPHMSGDKLARKMLEVAPRMPIILCTGFSVEVSELGLAHVGIKAVAMKPLVRNELARLIRQVLDADTG